MFARHTVEKMNELVQVFNTLQAQVPQRVTGIPLNVEATSVQGNRAQRRAARRQGA